MHPLLKRIVIHGAFVGPAVALVYYLLWRLMIAYLNATPGSGIEQGDAPKWLGPLKAAVMGLVVLALFEWIAYAREKARAAKSASR